MLPLYLAWSYRGVIWCYPCIWGGRIEGGLVVPLYLAWSYRGGSGVTPVYSVVV